MLFMALLVSQILYCDLVAANDPSWGAPLGWGLDEELFAKEEPEWSRGNEHYRDCHRSRQC